LKRQAYGSVAFAVCQAEPLRWVDPPRGVSSLGAPAATRLPASGNSALFPEILFPEILFPGRPVSRTTCCQKPSPADPVTHPQSAAWHLAVLTLNPLWWLSSDSPSLK